MTIGYQIINLGVNAEADGAEVLAKVKAAVASEAPILLIIPGYMPFWACSAAIDQDGEGATVNAFMGASYLTLTISAAGISVVEDTVAFQSEGE